jgi:hypothetical protein
MKKLSMLAGAVAMGIVMVPVSTGIAHHSVQNQFNVTYVIEKMGKLLRVDWVNPHSWFHFAEVDAAGNPVIGPDGRQVQWSIETTGPGGLVRAGIADRRLFVVGQVYGFKGYPSRTYDPATGLGETTMFTHSITFPDGRVVGVATFADTKGV